MSAASSSSTDHRPEKREKLIVIPYVSTFGYTEQLAEAIASGASQVTGIRTKLIDLKKIDIKEAEAGRYRCSDIRNSMQI